MDINPIDLAVVLILLVSALLAMVRGFVREVLSILGWVGAAVVAWYALPYALPYMQRYITHDMGAKIATAVTVFIVALAALSIIGHFVARGFEQPPISGVNRALGFLFGLARGGLLVCLAYLLVTWLFPEPDQRPRLIETAQTRPLIAEGAEFLKTLLPEHLVEQARGLHDQAVPEAARILQPPRPEAGSPDRPPEYNDRDRLNQLIAPQR